jgi:hypothetical protein
MFLRLSQAELDYLGMVMFSPAEWPDREEMTETTK